MSGRKLLFFISSFILGSLSTFLYLIQTPRSILVSSKPIKVLMNITGQEIYKSSETCQEKNDSVPKSLKQNVISREFGIDVIQKHTYASQAEMLLTTTAHMLDDTDVFLCPVQFQRWYNLSNKNVSEEINHYIQYFCKIKKTKDCQKKKLVGRLHVYKEDVEINWLVNNELSFVKLGGWWEPEQCHDSHQTAIVIPYKDRAKQLPKLLRQLLPILYRHYIHFRVFVIEQDDNNTFNRGKLMNVGYTEALKYFPYSCFVFHDVDLLPEDDRINYACKSSPAHLSVAVDKFFYILPYPEIFGGIEMFKQEHFKKINGFSNSFWKWGAEDDNLHYRVKNAGYTLQRQSMEIARYTMLPHKSNENDEEFKERNENLKNSRRHIPYDGLNSLQYNVTSRTNEPLYTHIKVDLRKEKDKCFDGFGNCPC